jgi:2-polyprenyl-3-methyl-5-hydroxy-6-metoxy-1,4-benzoquinol methylase
LTGAPSDRLRETYERRAELQYATPPELPDVRVDRKFNRLTALISGTLPAESLLDAGCGDGRFLAAIARRPDCPARLAGSDISETILRTAAQTLARENATAELAQANLEHLPFADASFDRVLCVQVIEHLLDPSLGIAELARVLKPGGILVLSTDSSRNHISRALNFPRSALVRLFKLTGRHAQVTFPHGSFTPAQVLAEVAACGLVVEHLETFRFHLDGINLAAVSRVLNAIDAATPANRWGDIVAVVGRKPV